MLESVGGTVGMWRVSVRVSAAGGQQDLQYMLL